MKALPPTYPKETSGVSYLNSNQVPLEEAGEATYHRRKSSLGEPASISKLKDRRGIRNQSPMGGVTNGLIGNTIARKISTADDEGKLPSINKTPISNGSSKLQHQSTKHETQVPASY